MSFLKPLNWKHITLFYIIHIVITIITSWIGKNAEQSTNEMLIIDLLAFITPPIILLIMLITYKVNKKLNTLEKLLISIGLITVNFICVFSLNFFNLLDRNPIMQDIYEGLFKSVIFAVIMLIICLPIIFLVKSRIVSNKISTI